jgi:hypothetical protein
MTPLKGVIFNNVEVGVSHGYGLREVELVGALFEALREWRGGPENT